MQSVLEALPRNFPTGIVIVQHMPPTFTKSLAERLNRLCHIGVKEAEHGETITAGNAYIAPGDQHLLVRRHTGKAVVVLSKQPSSSLHTPSVDVMTKSVAESYGRTSLGVILTGMGADGAEGLDLMKQDGSDIIAQDEDSCAVYGMPRAVVEAGIADMVAPLEQIPAEIMAYF